MSTNFSGRKIQSRQKRSHVVNERKRGGGGVGRLAETLCVYLVKDKNRPHTSNLPNECGKTPPFYLMNEIIHTKYLKFTESAALI